MTKIVIKVNRGDIKVVSEENFFLKKFEYCKLIGDWFVVRKGDGSLDVSKWVEGTRYRCTPEESGAEQDNFYKDEWWHPVIEVPAMDGVEIKLDAPRLVDAWVYKDKYNHERCYKTRIFDGTLIDSSYNFICPVEMDGVVELDNGKFLHKHYGKYRSGLSIIADKPMIEWERVSADAFNLPQGKLDIIRGDYFISKKGTNCFKIKTNGTHVLLRDDWGGAFCSYRGNVLPEDKAVYFRRASSNGGGSGYDYAVLPFDWKNTISEDDI